MTKVIVFEKIMKNGLSKQQYMDEVLDTATLATMIPLFIFKKRFHKRFEYHSMLESTLEI
jgi:hypothetical protein